MSEKQNGYGFTAQPSPRKLLKKVGKAKNVSSSPQNQIFKYKN
jgi:hypothetical protein